MDFDSFVNDIQRNSWSVYGSEVYEDGIHTHSFGDTRDNLHEIYSATKTILSIAVGIAVGEGKIDISRSVLSFLPENRIPSGQKEVFEQISIQRLMTMSVGDLPFRPEGDSYLDFSLNSKIADPNEKVFNYSNISAYLVGVALTEALETDLGMFIEKRVFDPLGIKRFEYMICPEGYFYGASGAKLTVNDLSKLGLLLYK